MKRNLILLNLLLVALCGVAGWRLKAGYDEELQREQTVLNSRPAAAPLPIVAIPPAPGQLSAANYYDIAAKMPFSRDRNPTVVVEVAPPKPMPALPRYYGLMNFGNGPRVILARAAGDPQKGYSMGDQIGDFKLVKIAESGLVFEWEGKEVPAKYAELRDSGTVQQAQTGGPAAAQAPAAPASNSAVSSVSSVSSVSGRPGVDVGASIKGCAQGDSSPAGTVADGYRKLITETPFGKSCRWEKVN